MGRVFDAMMLREREKERGRSDGAHQQRMCTCIDPWTISTSDQRVRIQHLSPSLHLAPPMPGLSFSLSPRPHLSSLSLSSRAPPRDNNYPFEALARGVAKVTIFLLATSPYAGYVRDWVSRGILQSIIHTSLFLSCHARSTVDLPWGIISAGTFN